MCIRDRLYIERNGQKRKISVRRIVGLADDLALALSAHAVRMEAPVPGRPYVGLEAVSYTHLRAHETVLDLVCRLLLEKKKKQQKKN